MALANTAASGSVQGNRFSVKQDASWQQLLVPPKNLRVVVGP